MQEAPAARLDRPDISGKSVIVTGGASGIGTHYVTQLVRSGGNVVIADLASVAGQGEDLAGKLSSAGPGRAVFSPVDITSEDDLANAVRLATSSYGGVDALVNNAAVYGALGSKRGLEHLTETDWDTVLTVNVRGTWQAIKAVVPAMADGGGGRIVNISSAVARNGAPGFAHYVASKAAVEGLTRAAARELGPRGIAVNAVAPGLIDDEASRTVNDPDYLVQAAGRRALGREMEPGDLVGTVLWLCSSASAFVTGQTIVVDGGVVFA